MRRREHVDATLVGWLDGWLPGWLAELCCRVIVN